MTTPGYRQPDNLVGGVYNASAPVLSDKQQTALQLDANGQLKIAGTISSTTTGFTPSGTVASLSVTTSSGNVALPAGNVVLVTNTGSTNTAFIKLSSGAGSAATTDLALVPGASVGLTVGANTYINAITSSSTTTLRLAGGDGLVTGFGGGGSSGGGGGAVTIADGADVTQGALADAAWVSGNGSVVAILKGIFAKLGTLVTGTVLAAGSAIVGKTSQVDSGGTDATDTTNHAVRVVGIGTTQSAAIAGVTLSPIAGESLSTTPTRTTAQVDIPVMTLAGSLAVQPYGLPDNSVSGFTAAMTGTASTAVTGAGAPGANLFNYITTIVVGNSHATVGTFVQLQDGNGGTAFGPVIPAAAVYGGGIIALPKPLKQPTANTALYCVNTTTGANVILSVVGYKAL